MSDMKCPFCQQELEERHAATTDYNSMFITYYCGNPECESTTDLVGCKEFWDILGQLIRTRKALDEAKKRLMKIGYLNMSDHGLGSEEMMTDWCKTVALHGLKEIETVLEQKE